MIPPDVVMILRWKSVCQRFYFTACPRWLSKFLFLSFSSRLEKEDIPLFVNQSVGEHSYVRFGSDIDDFLNSVVRDGSGSVVRAADFAAPDGIDRVEENAGDFFAQGGGDSAVPDDIGAMGSAGDTNLFEDEETVDMPSPPPPICDELSKSLQLLQNDR